MKDLFEAARAAFDRAHAPYSNFRVGAAVRAASGRIFAGANVETPAIRRQLRRGERDRRMVAAGERRSRKRWWSLRASACPPCGGCRQRLAEFAGPMVPIHLCDPQSCTSRATSASCCRSASRWARKERWTSRTSMRTARAAPEHAWASGGQRKDPSAVDVIQARFPGARRGSAWSLARAERDCSRDRGCHDNRVRRPAWILHPGVEGHVGRLVLGRLGGVEVACLQGRVHLYEACRLPRQHTAANAEGARLRHPDPDQRRRLAPSKSSPARSP